MVFRIKRVKKLKESQKKAIVVQWRVWRLFWRKEAKSFTFQAIMMQRFFTALTKLPKSVHLKMFTIRLLSLLQVYWLLAWAVPYLHFTRKRRQPSLPTARFPLIRTKAKKVTQMRSTLFGRQKSSLSLGTPKHRLSLWLTMAHKTSQPWTRQLITQKN